MVLYLRVHAFYVETCTIEDKIERKFPDTAQYTIINSMFTTLHIGLQTWWCGDVFSNKPSSLLGRGATHTPNSKAKRRKMIGSPNFVLCITNKLTPWSRILLEKSVSCSASQEITYLSWGRKVQYRVDMNPALGSILNHILSLLIEDPL